MRNVLDTTIIIIDGVKYRARTYKDLNAIGDAQDYGLDLIVIDNKVYIKSSGLQKNNVFVGNVK